MRVRMKSVFTNRKKRIATALLCLLLGTSSAYGWDIKDLIESLKARCMKRIIRIALALHPEELVPKSMPQKDEGLFSLLLENNKDVSLQAEPMNFKDGTTGKFLLLANHLVTQLPKGSVLWDLEGRPHLTGSEELNLQGPTDFIYGIRSYDEGQGWYAKFKGRSGATVQSEPILFEDGTEGKFMLLSPRLLNELPEGAVVWDAGGSAHLIGSMPLPSHLFGLRPEGRI